MGDLWEQLIPHKGLLFQG